MPRSKYRDSELENIVTNLVDDLQKSLDVQDKLIGDVFDSKEEMVLKNRLEVTQFLNRAWESLNLQEAEISKIMENLIYKIVNYKTSGAMSFDKLMNVYSTLSKLQMEKFKGIESIASLSMYSLTSEEFDIITMYRALKREAYRIGFRKILVTYVNRIPEIHKHIGMIKGKDRCASIKRQNRKLNREKLQK